MKLPFDFGVKLIFRLVVPGFFLSLGLFPILNTGLQLTGRRVGLAYAFPILIVLMGWLITISDMGIYIVLEGRRLWPGRVKQFCESRERRRLAKLIEKTKSADRKISAEGYFDLRNFPIGDNGDYVVMYPTRLGNILRAFERYSLRTYGIESTFFWWRMWLKLDKDTREEIDGSQALADSSVYAAFALFMSGLLWFLYLTLKVMKATLVAFCPALVPDPPSFIVALDANLPRKLVAASLSLVFILAGFLVYRLSLHLHAQFGELYKSLFDTHRGDINLSAIIKHVALLSENSPSVSLSRRLRRSDQFAIAHRFMQYYRYRCPNPKCDTLLKPSEIETHVCKSF